MLWKTPWALMAKLRGCHGHNKAETPSDDWRQLTLAGFGYIYRNENSIEIIENSIIPGINQMARTNPEGIERKGIDSSQSWQRLWTTRHSQQHSGCGENSAHTGDDGEKRIDRCEAWTDRLWSLKMRHSSCPRASWLQWNHSCQSGLLCYGQEMLCFGWTNCIFTPCVCFQGHTDIALFSTFEIYFFPFDV